MHFIIPGWLIEQPFDQLKNSLSPCDTNLEIKDQKTSGLPALCNQPQYKQLNNKVYLNLVLAKKITKQF